MKKLFKKTIIFSFRILTSAYLKKNRIEVIAITGSAGKTTVKVALSQILDDDETYIPPEGYNTEIGLPLSVFREQVPNKIASLGAWLKIIMRMLKKLVFSQAPYKRIVLEMGADHPGDIEYLTSFVKPNIAVVTTVMPVHTENFKNVDEIAEEKSKILKPLKQTDIAILNYDDEYVRKMADSIDSPVYWIGQNKKSNLYWSNITLSLDGMGIDLFWKGSIYPINLQIIAPQLLTSIFSAVAVCLNLGHGIKDIIKKVEKFQPQKGRMNLLKGKNDSYIIDDSYNANPGSTIAALEVLGALPGRKIAVLGSMNELGYYEKEGHTIVGQKAGEIAQILITIGDKAKEYIVPAAAAKIKHDQIKSFDNPYKAGKYLLGIIAKNDIILVKGSQNKVFAEEAVKAIMLDPVKNGGVLVRQDKFWINKKNECFKRKD